MRRKIIAGNWKMNKRKQEAEAFMEEAAGKLEDDPSCEAVICAPFPYLPTLVEKSQGTSMKIGAQTMHAEENGAYTGEVSPVMLRDIGVSYVIIGHSERRQYYNETDETVREKTNAAFEHGLTPIVCVGETLQQRENNMTKDHVERQVQTALQDLTAEQTAQTIIAYEPIWAIGTGKTASSQDANEVCTHIRNILVNMTSRTIAEEVVIQYGGSVKPDNIKELLAESDIDGALVGGASLDPGSFLELLEGCR